MAHSITLGVHTDRASRYAELVPQVRSLLEGETDGIAAMANLAAAVHGAFDWHWTGFYRAIGDELVLGPFQGPVACARIALGKGVCGTAWKEERTMVVPDVDLFPGHIACSALSRSEIVVPVRGKSGRVVAVMDIDSVVADDFVPIDAKALEELCAMLSPLFE